MINQSQTITTSGCKTDYSSQPAISVVMPIYNAEPYLIFAIHSIQHQTFKNWELIIVDDGSTDDSLKIAQKLADQDDRIRVFTQPHAGVATTANNAVSKARAKYIARMDADDVSVPERLAKQLQYLERNPDTVAVGAQCILINERGKSIGQKVFPTSFQALKEMMFYYYPLQQPTLMINTELLPENFDWYQPGIQAAEEHELLFKLLKYGKVINLPNFLLFYRLHDNNVTKKQPKRDFLHILKIRAKGIWHYHYWPSFKAILITFAQLFAVSLLPQKLIYPIYTKLRGL